MTIYCISIHVDSYNKDDNLLDNINNLEIPNNILQNIFIHYILLLYFDTPGFEDDKTVEMVLNTLRQFKKDIFHVDLILYYTKLNERTFLKLEIELIKEIIQENKNIIFVLNSFGKGKRIKNTIRLINTMKDYLAIIIKDLFPS